MHTQPGPTPGKRPGSLTPTFKIWFLCILGLIHLGVTFVSFVPGYINADEAIYHWMTKSLHDSGSLALWNGYEEFPKSLLIHPLVQLHAGRLFPQYPCVFAIMALPFYHLAGLFGLFLVNSMCFVGAAIFCLLAAKRLFGDMDLALNSCLLLVLGTFAWDHSQAAWPHVAEMCFAAASFYCFTCSYCSDNPRSSRFFAFAAGFVAAFGVGVRLDMILVFPGMILAFVFARPWRPRESIFVTLGAIPGLTVLSLTNLTKFGVLNPLSYGQMVREAMPSPVVLVVAAILILSVWIVTRTRYANVLSQQRHKLWLLCLAALFLALLLSTQAMAIFQDVLRGGLVSVIDVRFSGSDVSAGGAQRTLGGGVASVGAHRKALLQSLPYLSLLLVPILGIVRRGRDFAKLCIVFLVPLTVIGYYSFAFVKLAEGGLCLNTRYYSVCLPFFAIACAYAVRELRDRWGEAIGTTAFVVTCLLTALAYFALTQALNPTLQQQEFPFLVAPLVMAGLISVLVAASQVVNLERYALLSRTAWVCVVVAVVWSGLVAFFYDYPNHKRWRLAHSLCAQALREVIPDDSVVFTEFSTFPPAVGLKEKNRIRIALLNTMNQPEDLTGLLDLHLSAHRRAFGFVSVASWTRLERELLRPYHMALVLALPGFELREITLGPDQVHPVR
jgi:hypothetical protein